MLVGLALMGLGACGMAKAQPDVNSTDGDGKSNGSAAARTLSTGAAFDVTMGETITSRSNKAGETVTTTVDADVKDASGRVVIPAGSVVELTIAEITPARNKSKADGTLVLQVTNVTVRDRSYPLTAEITSLSHTLKGRGVTVGEVEKVAVGTTIGAVAGRVIGGNAKGTIIGGVIGAAGGTVVAVQTASRDVVVSAGTPVGITLTAPLKVSSQ
jgi:hypothetical protein